GVYTTSGGTVNPDLIPGIRGSLGGIAVSGDKLFVAHNFARPGRYGIGEYTTSGATVNAKLFQQVEAEDIALSGDKLFASNFHKITIDMCHVKGRNPVGRRTTKVHWCGP